MCNSKLLPAHRPKICFRIFPWVNNTFEKHEHLQAKQRVVDVKDVYLDSHLHKNRLGSIRAARFRHGSDASPRVRQVNAYAAENQIR